MNILDIFNSDEAMEVYNLHCSLNKLDVREQLVMRWRFFDNKTQSEVANMLGISRASLSRIEKRAIVKLKNMLKEG